MADTPEELSACSCGLALEVQSGQVYNEAAFRYFLTIERKRSEGSNRPFLILLIDLKKQPGMSGRVDPDMAAQLFSGLSLGLRETDFAGWYRDEYVVGAVLTQRADMVGSDVAGLVARRFKTVLCDGLPPDVARRLQVRVYQLSAEAHELNEAVDFKDQKSG